MMKRKKRINEGKETNTNCAQTMRGSSCLEELILAPNVMFVIDNLNAFLKKQSEKRKELKE